MHHSMQMTVEPMEGLWPDEMQCPMPAGAVAGAEKVFPAGTVKYASVDAKTAGWCWSTEMRSSGGAIVVELT